MKYNECNVQECRFYHMKETKRGQFNPDQNQNHQARSTEQNAQAQTNEKHNFWETKQKEQELQQTRDQVFMETQSSMMLMIQRLNVQLVEIQKSIQQNQTGWQEPRHHQQSQLQHQGWQQQPQQTHQQPQLQRGY